MFSSLFSSSEGEISSPFALEVPDIPVINSSGFRRGIDNVRIDVFFGDAFPRTQRILIDETMTMVMKVHEGKKQWIQPPKPQGHLLVKYQQAYVRALESSIYQAKSEDNPQLVWLARSAALAHVFDSIDQRLEKKTQELKRLTAQGAQGQFDAGKVALTQEQSAWMARHQGRFRDYLLALLLQQISTAEWGKVSKLSSAILGVSNREFIKLVLDNPVLKASKADDSWMMVQFYLLPPQQNANNNKESIAALNQGLNQMFSHIETKETPSLQLKVDDLDPCAAGFFPDLEQEGISLGWSDLVANIQILFSPKAKTEMYGITRLLHKGEDKDKKQQVQHVNNMLSGCQKLLGDLIKRDDLYDAIIASYKAPFGYQAISGALSHRLVYEYFLGGKAQRAIKNKIKSMGKISGDKPELLFNALDDVDDPDENRSDLSLRFLKTFVQYRHDLKIALLMKKHFSRAHVLESDNDLRLSRANGVLHHFSSDEAKKELDAEIVGHAIIKADVRGSIGITQSLRDKGLNPATHFSRTFFDPITDLLEPYGAEKVFVEGDAIILSLMEYSNDEQHMAVARACGISREILRIVEHNNEENRRNNLPVLELGIGIVYLTEAPAFLFDGDHKITISPAIGRSDRLSSCSKVVRPILEKAADHDPLRNVDVFAISEDGKSKNDKGEVHLLYNVDGIDLDQPAFMKLTKEINMKPLDARLFGGKVTERYYLGRFKDNKNHLRFIAIRQGRIRLWDPEQKKRKVLPKQYYFEVIADQDRLSQLETRLPPPG